MYQRKNFIGYLALIVFYCFILTGCVTATKLSKANFKETQIEENGYIFGSFYISKSTLWTNVGIDIQNIDTQKVYCFLFETNSSKPEKTMVIQPGKYKILNFYMVESYGQRVGTFKLVSDFHALSSEFEVNAGDAVYIGDYYAESNLGGYSSNYIQTSVQVKRISNNFDKTVKKISEKNSNFKNMKKVNLLEE